MSNNHSSLTARVGDRDLHIQTGKLAKLADGAALVTMGETVIIVTAVSATKVKDGQDFFPLTVEYKEKAAAVGRIPGSYFRREGRPTEKEILTCRMIDRPLRPLFPKGYFYDTQVIAILLSADGQNDPDILALNGASAALMVSDIPWAGPIAAVRVGRIAGKFIANPTHNENAESDLDLVYVGTEHESLMIEGSARELPEAEFKAALEFAQQAIQPIIKVQKELAATHGKKKRQAPLLLVKDELLEVAYSVAGSRIEAAIYQPSKVDRHKAVEALKDEVKAKVLEKFPTATPFEISQAFDYLQKKAFRTSILDKNKRCDGRPADQIRNLMGEVGILPRSHGSSLFARGETQAICLATLGPLDEAQQIDAYTGGSDSKRFILHYNFPPFSVGETGRFGGQSRREIGHGALAERSLEPVIPPASEFGYAIRVSSEIMESNGSTSMASVCGGTLALLDAGVPLKAPVAGISVGLVTEFDAAGSKMLRHQMLTDIIGSEDHFGDMDFKLCGTAKGVTGFQLDLKLPGLPLAMLKDAVDRAAKARHDILKFMGTILPAHRAKLSPYAPQIEMLKIAQDKIGLLIGPGGKTIKGICAETGAEVNVEDDGTVRIYANTGPAMARAKELISGLTGDIEVGKTYKGRVVSLKDFGAFVEIFPGRDGLVHISELAEGRVERVDDAVKMGDLIEVKCIGVDDKGRVKLSRKAVLREASGANGAPGRN
ncbi:MAG: polyribonucleotide nucleotidyltransferase [Verrucomicrobia bacterium]|nr:polyribonucleotide nucleotidyltransferase [Pseudomonadota bacterium]NBS06038.1 polyribonucleotide nucleotidyltransferase [Verrucomicrobiota bacterium]NBS78609.1 polyribonucleotide nucleotidyltransferase [bacterium]NBS50063.1 polyribonucleotide nucleotidyltransferase [Verrucomicrobiota bacterium]NBT23805.1 polyribonucleotide nucleotidyltransferase [bacterium]